MLHQRMMKLNSARLRPRYQAAPFRPRFRAVPQPAARQPPGPCILVEGFLQCRVGYPNGLPYPILPAKNLLVDFQQIIISAENLRFVLESMVWVAQPIQDRDTFADDPGHVFSGSLESHPIFRCSILSPGRPRLIERLTGFPQEIALHHQLALKATNPGRAAVEHLTRCRHLTSTSPGIHHGFVECRIALRGGQTIKGTLKFERRLHLVGLGLLDCHLDPATLIEQSVRLVGRRQCIAEQHAFAEHLIRPLRGCPGLTQCPSLQRDRVQPFPRSTVNDRNAPRCNQLVQSLHAHPDQPGCRADGYQRSEWVG